MPPETIPEPWQAFLKELDAALTAELCLHCIGGFVVTLLHKFSRTTSDLDVLVVVTKDENFRVLVELGREGSALYQKYGVYLDCVTIASVPESYEERLTEMFVGAFNHLRLFALDPHDLALSKLARNEQQDRDDVRYLAKTIPLDLEVLKERYATELQYQMGVPEREDNTLRLWIEMIEEDRQIERQKESRENQERKREK